MPVEDLLSQAEALVNYNYSIHACMYVNRVGKFRRFLPKANMNDIVLLLMACVMLAEGQILGNVPSQDLGPVYKLRRFIRRDLNLAIREEIVERLNLSEVVSSSTETHFEWEGYDGWYNNPAHPEWGGAGKSAVFQINL